jgi:hypothetical protein
MKPARRTALLPALGPAAFAFSLAVAASASAQELDLAATGTARPSIAGARAGTGHGSLGEVGYRHVLAFEDLQLLVGADGALPWARADLRDRLRVSVGLPLGGPRWKLAAGLSPTMRGTENAVSRMTALGADLRLAGGYHAPGWFIAGEAGLDWIAATHITFADAHRSRARSGAGDGWYRTPGSTAYTGLRGGVSFPSLDVIVRAGLSRTTGLEQQSVPFYLTMGANVAL